MKSIIKIYIRLLTPVSIGHWFGEVVLAIPRIFGGLMLTASFGSDKFGLPWSAEGTNLSLFEVSPWFAEDVATFGFPFSLAPIFFAWMGAASEALGGLFLLLGFHTRIFGFLLSITMLVAIFYQQWDNGMWSMLPAMGFLWIALYCLVLGSGKLGLDNFIGKYLSKSNYN